MEREKLQAFILKKEYNKYVDDILDISAQELRDRVEDCVLAYGMIMTKDGKVLTLKEMENVLEKI